LGSLSDTLDLLLKGVKMGVDLSKEVENLAKKNQAQVAQAPGYNLDQLTDDLAVTLRAKDGGKTLKEAVQVLQARKVPDSIILDIMGRIYGGK